MVVCALKLLSSVTRPLSSTFPLEFLKNQPLFFKDTLILKCRRTLSSISTHRKPSYPSPIMSKHRLLPHITPNKYQITLHPSLGKKDFTGIVEVQVTVTKDSNEIWMHSDQLLVQNVWVDGTKASFKLDKEFQLVVISLESGERIAKGSRTIKLEFSGDLDNRIVGFYASNYTSKGENRVIATTKFEPTYARKAFPCFDEPNMKANFTVHILKPKDGKYIALSNMPQTEEKETPEGTMVSFKTTVKMSTYLLAFIVCDFNYTEQIILPQSDKIPLRVYATPAQIEKTKYATQVGVGAIEYYINYYGIKYPLPKLDMVAIPDFVSGAMENWGLVTFRETRLLYDPRITSTFEKQQIAETIAHELTHSWFGNLVTMNWWNDLWLNEGFASYIAYKGVDSVFPDWQMIDQFQVDTLHPVMGFDATPAAHPIVQNVTTPDQITEIFDAITYNKGASVLRMLETTVGEETFRKGVTNYLNLHKFGNAVTENLLHELQALRPELDIKEFVNTFTVQSGYPIVTVKEKGKKLTVTQKRFLKDPLNASKLEPSPYSYKWLIPLTYVTDRNPEPTQVWFNNSEEILTIDKPQDIKWIKFNYNQTGYYRVMYEAESWANLAENIKDMTVADKTHLLEDSFSIAASGELTYNVPLDLTKYLKEETNFLPWDVAASKLRNLHMYLMNSQVAPKFLAYVIDIISPMYDKVGWNESESDSHLTKLARRTVLDLACYMEMQQSLDEATQRFKKWLDNSEDNRLSPDLKKIIYKYGVAGSGKEEWEKLWEIYVNETDAGERITLMHGLASSKDVALLRRLLNLGANQIYVRGQDYFQFLAAISQNPVGTSLVWDYFRENWPAIVERFTLNDRNLGRLVPQITARFTTATKLKEMEAFFAEYPDAGAGVVSRKVALENVKNNIKWLEKNKQDVEHWVEQYHQE